MTDYRTFCRRLIEVLEQYAPLHPDDEKLVRHAQAAIDGETLLEAVGMEKELYNPLRLNGYTSVEQVLEADPKDLMECKGLGPDRVGRILAAIRKHQRESAMDGLRQASADASGVELDLCWWQKAARARLEKKAQAIFDAYCTLADLRNRSVSESEMLAAALRETINQCQNGQGMIPAPELLRIATQLDVAEDDIDLFQAQ